MPGVAVYVDGIDQTSTIGLFTMGVVEVDRIEVLRGPQGTLFGNSALGGAVHYVTRQASDEFGARVQVRAGTFDKLDMQASVDVPITEKFLTKFTFADMSTEGYMQSVDSGYKYGDINDQFYRADLLFHQPRTWTYATVTTAASRIERAARAPSGRSVRRASSRCPTASCSTRMPMRRRTRTRSASFTTTQRGLRLPGGVLGEYDTRVAHDTNGLQLDLDRQTLEVDWSISDAFTFRALAGDRKQTRRLMVDFDSDSRVFFADRQDNDEINEESYELQFLGTHGDRGAIQLGRRLRRQRAQHQVSRPHVPRRAVRLRAHRKTRRGPAASRMRTGRSASTTACGRWPSRRNGHAANDAGADSGGMGSVHD